MRKNQWGNVVTLVLVVVVVCFAVDGVDVMASKLPSLGLIDPNDGVMNEMYWNAGDIDKQTLTVADGQVTYGTVDDASDCDADFVCLWDESGFYLGLRMRDDVHSAPNSQFLQTANDAYGDDATELFLDNSYIDASTTDGALGLQLVKGFGEENLYGGCWAAYSIPGLPGGTWGIFNAPVADWETTFGWTSNYHSDDGLNYECENYWPWDKPIMQNVGTKSEGDELGLEVGVCDNDDPWGTTSEGMLRWGASGEPNERWNKVILSGMSSVVPVKTRLVLPTVAKQMHATYDIQGRRVTRRSMVTSMVHFELAVKTKKTIHIQQ